MLVFLKVCWEPSDEALFGYRGTQQQQQQQQQFISITINNKKNLQEYN